MDSNSSFSSSTNRPPPPPVPPSRRSTVILPSSASTPQPQQQPVHNVPPVPPSAHGTLNRIHAPSPPPKPSSLSSPVPPRKPVSLAAAAIAATAVNSFSSTSSSPAPVPAPRPFTTLTNNQNTSIHNGFSSAPSSNTTSPASSCISAFPSSHGQQQGQSSGTGTGTDTTASSPGMNQLHAHLRSQTIPISPSHLRPSGSTTFTPAAASSLIAAKQHLLLQQQQQHQNNGGSLNTPSHPLHADLDHPPSSEEHFSNPFSDPSNIASNPTSSPPVTIAASSPPYPPRAQNNQSSLLTARLQASPASPSLQAPHPVPISGFSTSPRANAASSPPPPLPPPASAPALPLRSRSPLAGHPAPPLAPQTPTSTPRQNRLSMVPPTPPQSLAMSSPSQPVPPPPRRSSVQLSLPSTPLQQQQPQPRGPSPLFPSPGESGMAANSTRFRNLTAPQHTYDNLSPASASSVTHTTPKRIFSTSASSAIPFGASATSPVPERGFAQMDLSGDSQSDSDETSDDSDKEYDEFEECNPSLTSATVPQNNPFVNHFADTASPRPTRARTFIEPPSPTPPSLPSRRPPPQSTPAGRPTGGSLSDQDVAPALPPKPSVRRRPQPHQDPGSLLSLGQIESENYPTQPVGGSGSSASDGVFPDYSRSNRRLPLFSDVINIHDIGQKSHGVRTFTISNEQVATATSNIRVYSLFTGENVSSYGHEKDMKPTALLFTQSRRPESLGQYIWAGWSEGSLQVIDTRTREVVEKKRATHRGGSITHIIRCKGQVWTVDDTGSVFVWAEDSMLGRPTIQAPLQSLTIQPKQICAIAVHDMLWSSDGAKIHVVRVGPDNGRPKMPSASMDIPYGIGPLTCLATIAGSGQVFSGHEDGKVIIWSIESREKVRIVNVHAYRIMSLLGVGSYLWAGFATGKIYVMDLRPEIPVVMKDWQAHKDSGVAMLQLDEEGLILGSRHQVGSCAENGEIKIWDGLMAKDRLTKGMVDRSKEYCQWRDLKVLICSWNIDASKPAAQDMNGGSDRRLFESWLTSMEQEGPPDIISVGFQEIVDLESKKMTAKSLLKGSKRAETETISKQYKRWQIYLTNKIRELYAPMGVNFKLLECSNLVGLFSCVFVRDQEWANIRTEWTHVDMVKTGLKGYHGNKGGIATRLIIDDTSISFVNCHLAAGQSHTRQRNIDAANVLKKLCHPNPAISSEIVHPEVFWFGDGTMAMDHEVCFLSGDLNYRIDVKFSEAVSRVQSQDWEHLHQHDQLLQQKLRNPQFVLRVFNESELRFAPTYKYDPGTDTYDTSSKHRTPAWCDRILWRGRHVRQLFYKRCECRVSDHKPISGGFVVGVKRIDEAQRRIVEQQVKEGWFKVQEKEIRIKKLAWLRSWGWSDPRVEGILDREGGDLGKVVQVLMAE
ncbi:hypothetical protein BGZ83_011456 [Gryganskiella cystojenkinii]|nr:hypothetical protein BGZ83_011456 [Gryganskiella cystojenkinii]